MKKIIFMLFAALFMLSVYHTDGFAEESADEAKYLEIGFHLMENERMGGLHYGMSERDVIALLGEPTSKDEPAFSEADGNKHWAYFYDKLGLTIEFIDGIDEAGMIYSYRFMSAAFKANTAKGIRIGSTKQEVLTAYKHEISESEQMDTDMIIVGTIYGGIIFEISNNKVSSIFVGGHGN